MKKFSFVSIACLLLAPACLVNADDDDQNTSDNTVSDTNETDQTSNPSTSNPSTSDGTTGDESTSDTPSTTTDAETGLMTSSGATTGGVACGWGMLGPDDEVEFGYLCGGMGADPDGMFEMECPVDLMAGGDCTEMMITAEGCCDADGDAWFCQDPDGAGPMDPVVVEDPCE